MADRPLSPHLQVYRPQLTSTLSILHRISGVLLAAGTVLVVYWLYALAAGPEPFSAVNQFLGSILGKCLLVALGAAGCYHLLNGVRHLLWDAGWGLDLPTAYRTGWTVVALTALATVALAVLVAGGGA